MAEFLININEKKTIFEDTFEKIQKLSYFSIKGKYERRTSQKYQNPKSLQKKSENSKISKQKFKFISLLT
jgi:hypothetical protein